MHILPFSTFLFTSCWEICEYLQDDNFAIALEPITIKNQIVDSFQAYIVYIMDSFYHQMSDLKGDITKLKMDQIFTGKR